MLWITLIGFCRFCTRDILFFCPTNPLIHSPYQPNKSTSPTQPTIPPSFNQYGISGAFWYAAGAALQVLLFSTLTIQMKIKAPGAKTYLQIVRARFDSQTHFVYVFFALLTNLLVTVMLMLGLFKLFELIQLFIYLTDFIILS